MVKLRFKLWFLFLAVAAVCAAILISHFANTTQANALSSAAFDADALFNSKCAKCHGKDGRSKTMRGRLAHSRDLSSSEWQNDVSDERIFNSISNGKGKMPSFKKSLSEDQINSLVTFVRRLRK
jgi:cytochrome c6